MLTIAGGIILAQILGIALLLVLFVAGFTLNAVWNWYQSGGK